MRSASDLILVSLLLGGALVIQVLEAKPKARPDWWSHEHPTPAPTPRPWTGPVIGCMGNGCGTGEPFEQMQPKKMISYK